PTLRQGTRGMRQLLPSRCSRSRCCRGMHDQRAENCHQSPNPTFMNKYLHLFVLVIFSLILILPVLGTTGMLGEATRDLYNTDRAFAFIQLLTDIRYINYMMAVVHLIALAALWTKREALAALLVLPITLNVVAFHLVIDGGLFTGG